MASSGRNDFFLYLGGMIVLQLIDYNIINPNVPYDDPEFDKCFYHDKALYIHTTDKEIIYYAIHHLYTWSYAPVADGVILLVYRSPTFAPAIGEDRYFKETCDEILEGLNGIISRRASKQFVSRSDIYRMLKAARLGDAGAREYVAVIDRLRKSETRTIHILDFEAVAEVFMNRQEDIFDQIWV